MKIAFFLENKYYNSIDFSRPENGNPGIRGTQYMFWMVAYLLSFRDIEVHLFAPNTDTLPERLIVHKCETELEAVKYAKKLNIDIIVLRGMTKNRFAYDELLKLNQKCIVWSHNFENNELAEMIANNSMIKANVCVGRQQYERLVDHKVFKKSTYIYNSIDFQNYIPEKCKKDNIVMYLGSLEKGKGFYKLAKVWKKIICKVPDAQLYVLGKGNMGSNGKLGEYGLASPYDEKCFIKHLTNKDGSFLPNVYFMGSVGGIEKFILLNKAKVGVVNPTGKGETFCIGAIEFQALGIPVVSKKGFGLLDTVQSGQTGMLTNNEHQLYKTIVKLLKNTDENHRLGTNGNNFVRSTFNFSNIIYEWEQLLSSVMNDEIMEQKTPKENFFNQYKWLRVFNSKLQQLGFKTFSVLKLENIGYCIKKFLLGRRYS